MRVGGRENNVAYQVIVRLAVRTTLQVFPLNQVISPDQQPKTGEKMKSTNLNEALDTFLDAQRVGLETHGELSRNFVHQVVMGHMLSILHDAHDACLQNPTSKRVSAKLTTTRAQKGKGRRDLCLMPSLLVHPVLCLFPLFSTLNLRRHRTDLDLLQR